MRIIRSQKIKGFIFYFLFLCFITIMRNRISYIDFEKTLAPFGIFQLSDILKAYPAFDTRRLHEWQKKGYITKLIKGHYIFNSIEIDETVLFQIANVLSRPSYISLESALSYYHFIPEQSFSIISATTSKTNHYKTSKGSFLYQSVKPSLFFGYRVLPSNGRPILMAEPEKAILDFLYLHPELKDVAGIEALRLNSPELEILDEQRMNSYLQLFDKIISNNI